MFNWMKRSRELLNIDFYFGGGILRIILKFQIQPINHLCFLMW